MAATTISKCDKQTIKVNISIDENSGFCFGVVNAITKAEKSLNEAAPLYCLGDIVHNTQELQRLQALGLKSITHDQIARLRHKTILLRAHGEPPETYLAAQQNSNTIIDATCPVVLQLQKKIKQAYTDNPTAQIVIYGKNGHAEVNGLVGQTSGNAIVVESKQDASRLLDFSRDIILFSQTTMSVEGFKQLVEHIRTQMNRSAKFSFNDTICRQVANRVARIRTFAARFALILFVSDAKSSNGKILFEECRKVNQNSLFISSAEQVTPALLQGVTSIGICGATSTPKWLMEQISARIKSFTNQ